MTSEPDPHSDPPSESATGSNERTNERTKRMDTAVNQETAVDVCARIEDSTTGDQQ